MISLSYSEGLHIVEYGRHLLLGWELGRGSVTSHTFPQYNGIVLSSYRVHTNTRRRSHPDRAIGRNTLVRYKNTSFLSKIYSSFGDHRTEYLRTVHLLNPA